MKKKTIWIIIASIVVLLVAAYAFLMYRNRSLSPPGEVSATTGDLTVSITYSRPSVRERLIFGTEEQEALQPYGKYWRLGANEATEVTFNRDVTFNGSAVKAGTYRMYAVPGPEEFEIALNSQLGQWGAFEPDYELDILKTRVPVAETSSHVEQFTISLPVVDSGIDIVFEFGETRFVVPVR
ncbi:MAG TPA: DUF2911 domain-containing protein [Ohtaekwangia sp.]|nr:DUF2911 domain-containing protein [Ohtaekwangia sp.]